MRYRRELLGLALALALLAWGGPGLAAPAAPKTASGPLAPLSQDESSLEKAIAKYLKDSHKLSATFRFMDKDYNNLFLEYSLAADEAPRAPLFIDTVVSARNKKTKEVTGRVVKIFFFYNLPASLRTARLRQKILELNNLANLNFWVPSSVCLTPDGKRLLFASYLSIPNPETPLQLSLVSDTLVRMVRAWEGYYPQLQKLLPKK